MNTQIKSKTEKVTGFPSIDMPWLRYYKEGAFEFANTIPQKKTIWDVIEEKLQQYPYIPAIEYFGRKISRQAFTQDVYKWAKVFKSLGVKENDVIPFYTIFTPDICTMAFALNMIGACPYFLKLAINQKNLEKETEDSKIAVAVDILWKNVQQEFTKDRFEKVIIIRIEDEMPCPKKQIAKLISKSKNKTKIPKSKKIISVAQAKKLSKNYEGPLKVPFVPNRASFITASSGTSFDAPVKGIVATNETVIALLKFCEASDIPFEVGGRILNNFPPMAATALNSLYINPLYRGGTIVMDPRVSEEAFYNQLTKLKPNVVLYTGCAWNSFFKRIEKEMQKKHFDFSYATFWIIGGEGTDLVKYQKWNKILTQLGGQPLFSGYGQSELFSVTCVENKNVHYESSKNIITVGIPYAGVIIGVFDKNGKELSYNQRGEIWIKSITQMKEYYKKPELTAKVKVNGWIKTGDLGEIDERGFVYIWGRLEDSVLTKGGKTVYLFDIANKIKEKNFITEAIVLPIKDTNSQTKLVAHLVWADFVKENQKDELLLELTDFLAQYEKEITLNTFFFHEKLLPYSPATFKTDKNKMLNQKEGYVQVINGKITTINVECS